MTTPHPRPTPAHHRRALAALTIAAAGLLLGSSNGAWLHRVSPADHARPNPLVATPEARDRNARAGAQLYSNECAKCHGADGGGLHGRPPIISDRIDGSSDGDLFWLMTNGNPWRGMPPWNMLPAAQRWQLVTYIRSLNLAEDRAGASATNHAAATNARPTTAEPATPPASAQPSSLGDSR